MSISASAHLSEELLSSGLHYGGYDVDVLVEPASLSAIQTQGPEVPPKRGRGRPKKSYAGDDVEEESSDLKRGRGRPKKSEAQRELDRMARLTGTVGGNGGVVEGKKRGRPVGTKNKPGHNAGRPKKGFRPPTPPPKVKRPVGRPRKNQDEIDSLDRTGGIELGLEEMDNIDRTLELQHGLVDHHHHHPDMVDHSMNMHMVGHHPLELPGMPPPLMTDHHPPLPFSLPFSQPGDILVATSSAGPVIDPALEMLDKNTHYAGH